MLRKVLVANRGEIAVRIFRTLSDMGISSVAVYSEADRQSIHTEVADEAHLIGPAPSAESYLRIDKIIEACKQSKADAVHPGYGFLAENANFAQAVIDAGLIWIGPPPAAMRIMGDKVSARRAAMEASVDVVPGTSVAATLDTATDFGNTHGYPIAVKAVMGGGGKAFRVAQSAKELPDAFEGAAREAQNYFGDPSLFVEKYVVRPRHVEAQILADTHGTVAFLGERDCSTQRRHQKLIEEAPSPAVTEAIRDKIASQAIALAKQCGYQSAGTVEMLLDEQGQLFFLEMNTRLQVEHPVTELVCGVDLVAEQIRIAAGEPLGYERIEPRGWAIECRINAEDPTKNFLPSPGQITRWDEPPGPFIRVDAGFGKGRIVPQAYDSLIAKLVVFGANRDQARTRMLRALEDFSIEGVETSIPFHRAFVGSEEFAKGLIHTKFVEDEFSTRLDKLLRALPEPKRSSTSAGSNSAGSTRDGTPETILIEVDSKRYEVTIIDPSTPVFRPLKKVRSAAMASGRVEIRSRMQGTILSVAVDQGQQIKQGELIAVLEAMKMENHITSPKTGVVTKIEIQAGDAVSTDDLIAIVE